MSMETFNYKLIDGLRGGKVQRQGKAWPPIRTVSRAELVAIWAEPLLDFLLLLAVIFVNLKLDTSLLFHISIRAESFDEQNQE
jgi:hypothetical protein